LKAAGRDDANREIGVPLEEAGADAIGDVTEIDHREEIDGAELGIDGGRTAEAAGILGWRKTKEGSGFSEAFAVFD